MNKGDTLWFQNILKNMQNGLQSNTSDAYTSMYVLRDTHEIFLEDICEKLKHHIDFLNSELNYPEALFRLFRLGAAQKGVLLLRGKDKLVVASEGLKVHLKIVRIQSYGENMIKQFIIETRWNEWGSTHFWCSTTEQPINADLLITEYIAPFLMSGSLWYERNSQF